MKKILFILVIAAFPALVESQSISREVKSTDGDYNESSEMTLASTFGQPITGTFENGSMVLTQGFQQPTIVVITSTEELAKKPLSVRVYPNPAQQFINLDITTEKEKNISWAVYNSTGQRQAGLGGELTVNGKQSEKLNFYGLSAGSYYIRFINDNGKELKTIKVQKIK